MAIAGGIGEMRTRCRCSFIAVGRPLDAEGCYMHKDGPYPCTRTGCADYRPNKPKLSATHWPRCVCGEIAQEHN